MEEVLPFEILIPYYKVVSDGTNKVVYYTIEIYKIGIKKWNIEKRFREFVLLHTQLVPIYGNLPPLPSKSLLPLSDPTDIDERRKGLEAYLQGIIGRKDIFGSNAFKRFFQIENFAPELLIRSPILISETIGFRFGIRDFYYQEDMGLLFVAVSDMNVFSRLDAYISNIKFPWSKKEENAGHTAVGALECYRQIGQKDQFKFEKLWTRTFPTQVIVIYWDAMSSLLAIGGDDGNVVILKIYRDQTFHEVRTIQMHEKRIMGLYIHNISENIYAVAEDGRFSVYEIKTGDMIADMVCSISPLTGLSIDSENKRAFVSNTVGSVFIFDISTKVPELIHIAQAHPNGLIRSMHFDAQRNYLITTSYDDGVLAITDLQKPGKERYSVVVANFEGKPKARCCTWSSTRTEIYTGTEDGIVTFWDAKTTAPLYALKAHTAGVTKLQLLERQGILITAGKDKKLAFYKLPLEWRDKKVEALLHRESMIRRKTTAMIKLKRTMTRMEEDPDESDLSGWAQSAK